MLWVTTWMVLLLRGGHPLFSFFTSLFHPVNLYTNKEPCRRAERSTVELWRCGMIPALETAEPGLIPSYEQIVNFFFFSPRNPGGLYKRRNCKQQDSPFCWLYHFASVRAFLNSVVMTLCSDTGGDAWSNPRYGNPVISVLFRKATICQKRAERHYNDGQCQDITTARHFNFRLNTKFASCERN